MGIFAKTVPKKKQRSKPVFLTQLCFDFFTFLAVKYKDLPVLDNVIIFEKQLLLEKSEKRKSPKFGSTNFFSVPNNKWKWV